MTDANEKRLGFLISLVVIWLTLMSLGFFVYLAARLNQVYSITQTLPSLVCTQTTVQGSE